MNSRSIYNYTIGFREPPADVLIAMCNAFPAISLDYLLKGEGTLLKDGEDATYLLPEEMANNAIEERRKETDGTNLKDKLLQWMEKCIDLQQQLMEAKQKIHDLEGEIKDLTK